MLFTAGDAPVAHEFAYAARPGDVSLEFSPVSAECPSATIPTVPSADATDAEVDGWAVPVEVGSAAVLGSEDATADCVVVVVGEAVLVVVVAWRPELLQAAAVNNVATMPIERRFHNWRMFQSSRSDGRKGKGVNPRSTEWSLGLVGLMVLVS